MILDAIIALFGSIFGFVVDGLAAAFVPLFNLIAAGIEAVVALFVSGFSLGRIQRKQRDGATKGSAIGGLAILIVVGGLIGGFLAAPRVMNRKVTLVAQDGHSLPFAAIIIHTRNGDQHERTDHAGKMVIPRFGTHALTIKDPRYVEQRWEKSEIQPHLTVSRTVLGSGLDSLADRLLKPARE